MSDLTKEQIYTISLGYNWNPDMDYHDFSKLNTNLKSEDAYAMFLRIEKRYLEFKYENDK